MLYIFTTGGTIEGIDYKDGQNNTEQKIAINDFLKKANVGFEYIIERVFEKDSREITNEDRRLLASKIETTDATKILITHGTYTMEDTAKYLGELYLNKTIVLVGSFISGSSLKTDAPFNIGYAISSLQHLKPDVYIAMNGQVFNWKNVTKNLRTNKFERNA